MSKRYLKHRISRDIIYIGYAGVPTSQNKYLD